MRYLFQGDSITDCGRGDYGNPYATGCGYPRLLEADLMAQDGDCEVMNCGISGNRVVDLLARWKRDCLNLKPDVITILIGVNDVWHEFGNHDGVSVLLFEEVYRILLRETFAALPQTRLILMGAYVMPGPATTPDWDVFSGEVAARREVTRKLAEEFGLTYVDLQEAFDEAQKKFPVQRWTGDGVHPTAAGHEVIAEAWKKAAGV
ncbi:SGNH/GDSL hydrolase family protein [uncultured Acetatifactor sp.]|uniref:SGNH/GDSL hydrolase family protein n=1 Tax=uncultured Acetatifactor sp. TaxID=1671927 RepID=UPI00261D6FD3|nr:SGNH/GDSL hydrolase family protein [uncultured Acetatifactor sp.]